MLGFMQMVHDQDPKQLILEDLGMSELGVLPGFKLYGNRVLVAVYKRPDTLKSGIVLPDQTRKEDEHQGKSGLVVMMGPTAFVSDDHYDFRGQTVQLGDWISLWVSDGRQIKINGVLCRVVRDVDINFVIPSPDVVY